MKPVYLLTTLVLMGCASNVPQPTFHKNVSEKIRFQDQSACRVQSMTIQQSEWAYRGTFLEGANIEKQKHQIYSLCMQSKGYVLQY